MSVVLEHDKLVALDFYASDQAMDLICRYEGEVDGEVRSDPTKMATYIICREQGVDPVFADMRACRRGPGAANCDRHFNEAARRRMYGMGPNMEKVVATAKAAGINTSGKFYVGGLGRYQDPRAWVSTSDDILEVARKKNLNVTGAVNHTAHPVDPPKPKPMADDIMQEMVGNYMAREPETAEKIRKDPKRHLPALKERILDKHTKRKKSNG